MSTYNTAKAGLSGFSRSLMLEARACGSPVQVLDFQPGDYHTGFNQALQAPREDAPPALRQAWMALERNLKAGPPPEHAARRLRFLLARGRSGQYASGGFFQARLAPLGARLLGWNRLAPCILRYHRIRPGEPPPEA